MATNYVLTVEELEQSLPKLTGRINLKGLTDAVEIYRDAFGIPHVRATNKVDAFFAQGFATAQDRLWQMDYDRRRGTGRWAEVAGPSALEGDKLMRRFRLEPSARRDYQSVGKETRSMLDAYAWGVNAFIESTESLPIEYKIAGLAPEPWQPWDGLVVYKVRHILMGVFESKVWRAQMVRHLGPEKAATLFPGYQPGQPLILPPGTPYGGLLDIGLEQLRKGASALNYLSETDSGSNSWAISGSRTASGYPILAGDSHRALDTPNVYYQNHLACPEFDVIGLSFAGVPGFPHFGHNPWVAWSVTHTGADYQDLYIERFKEGDSAYYLYQDQWLRAEVYQETIKVRGGQDVPLKVWVTHHGPVISGDPLIGVAISFRYTATNGPSVWPETLGAMLTAKNSDELMESMREWVDPCNNFLFADVHGNIGYLCRGKIPLRPKQNAWLPVPGWTGEHEWQGEIPFEELPRSINPKEGYIATANNKPVGDDYPYFIAVDFAPSFRVERVTKGLLALENPNAEDMVKIHSERISIPAQTYIKLLKNVEPQEELSNRAREKLLAWSGKMDADAIEPTIYSAVRDALLHEVLAHNLGDALTKLAWDPANRGRGVFLNRFKALLISMIEADDRSLLPLGENWTTLAARSLTKGVSTLRESLGPKLEDWVWGKVHQARPGHTLSSAFPHLADSLDPPPIPMSGDGDTPLAGSYSPAEFAKVGGLSVARYSFDLADWSSCLWVVPLGSSGHPGSPHYHDQSESWRQVQMVPMYYDWERIVNLRETEQKLTPI
ncbi:MAG: penicillin acylase family protein [Chloroflexi bacterium]|nr:penicillin acylase family protein [Chloroflexota bacterium]